VGVGAGAGIGTGAGAGVLGCATDVTGAGLGTGAGARTTKLRLARTAWSAASITTRR
jgi:hypothetical protein